MPVRLCPCAKYSSHFPSVLPMFFWFTLISLGPCLEFGFWTLPAPSMICFPVLGCFYGFAHSAVIFSPYLFRHRIASSVSGVYILLLSLVFIGHPACAAVTAQTAQSWTQQTLFLINWMSWFQPSCTSKIFGRRPLIMKREVALSVASCEVSPKPWLREPACPGPVFLVCL